MKINELKPNTKVDVVVGKVIELKAPRNVTFNGNTMKVADGVLADETGNVNISIWEADVDKVKLNDQIKITNGWVSSFKQVNRLSAGKFGSLEVLV